MRIKIISDGTVHGTQIVNADTGEEIEYVVRAEWKIVASAPRNLATATLELWNVPVEIVGEVKEAERGEIS